MAAADDIKGIFDSYDPYNFDPSECLQRCIDYLDACTTGGGDCDPRRSVDAAMGACNAYGFASQLFLANRLPSAAVQLLVRGWNDFSRIQKEERRRVYRAGIGMYLARVYLALKDNGAALRWGLHTQADDVLGEHVAGGGAGRQMLHTILGMSTTAITELNRVVTQNLEDVRTKYRNDWSSRCAFPEDGVRKFALNWPEFSHLFSLSSSVREYPLCPAYFCSLMDAIDATALSGKEKGDRLEDLASYLFLLIPSLVPRRNLLEETQAHETDIVVRNLGASSNLVSDLLGRHFLVECKNWENPLGVSCVGYFLYRMHLTHSRCGVIFAKSGITGDGADERASRSLIRKAFHEDGSICIVFNREDLRNLADGSQSFWSIILERMERIPFGRAK